MISRCRLSMQLLVLFFCSCVLTSVFAKKNPNVVVIFMDDMGYGDLSDYGAIGYATPHLSSLARNGTRFTSFYAAQAVCSASRAALLTGCYPNRVGIYGALLPNVPEGLHPQEETIAELLREKGYRTGMVGKWHLGNRPEFLPTRQGFAEYYGLPYSNDMWPHDYDGKPNVKDRPPLPLLHSREGRLLPDTVKIINTLEDQSLLTKMYTEKAVAFIRQNSRDPFFLYLAHNMPHTPIVASAKFRGRSVQGPYGDVMTEIDWSVGQIVEALKAAGVLDNTLLIFTSDNGPWLNFGDYGGNTAGLREGKGTSWEGGMRVPALISWPGVLPKGAINHKIACNIDILPTVAAACGARLPARKIDGVNLLPMLLDENVTARDHLFYYYNRNDLEAVRQGSWKLVFPHAYRSYENVLPGINDLRGPYSRARQDSLALYDLRRDPGERYNVIARYPDVVEKLKALADKARADLGDDLMKIKGANRRPAGGEKN